MVGSFTPRILRDAAVMPREPAAVVETFLGALATTDWNSAGALLDEHVTYVNVGLPAIHGRHRTLAVLRPLDRPGGAFEVYLHAVAVNGATVLTERTDVLVYRRLRLQFWVTGRFDVRDGRITLWRDSFDYLDILRALGRGVLGAVLPALQPAPPSSAERAPGRH